jgi:hypothetical protein
MATINKGILGGFSGKIGPVVGFLQGDKFHMRSLPRRRKKYTKNELDNQAKFKRVQQHLEPIKELIKVGFKDYYTKSGGYRAAFAYTRKMAMVEDDAGFYIDPGLFKISGGDLEGAINPVVSIQNFELLSFSWNISAVRESNGSDQVIVLVYDTANSRVLTRIFDGGFRNTGELHIPIPKAFKGTEVDVYIGFIAADRSAQSDSQYLGRLTIPG